MPSAPEECPNQPDLTKCRITQIGSRSTMVNQPSVFDGNGNLIPSDTRPPMAINDYFCGTCGLQWSEESGVAMVPRKTNVRRIGDDKKPGMIA